MEGGGAAGGEAGGAPSYAIEINPTAIDIRPAEPCPFDAPLSLAIDFTASAPLAGAHWKLRYMVDMAHARHIVEMAESDVVDYGCGMLLSSRASARRCLSSRRLPPPSPRRLARHCCPAAAAARWSLSAAGCCSLLLWLPTAAAACLTRDCWTSCRCIGQPRCQPRCV